MGNEKREKINGLKGCQPEEEEEDKEVEEKMNKFYALIRSFRDARDRRRNELLKEMEINNNNNKNNKKRKAAEQQIVSSLVPSFRMEDFTQQGEAEFKRTPLKFRPTPSSIKIHEPDDDDLVLDKESGLDLKLAL
ncbi:hypothetical protein RHSIM_Rhsim13G0001700 [Rhododendron simsii]|uniref:Uncharacterized protein n=1 Tax=Rhododendron simsii TaxID=118357 RepID=A0A834FZF7_RHOSS|nr:hypothetical protein RHSIM_Rhsim13G0001700 [Rhododendron simsii]